MKDGVWKVQLLRESHRLWNKEDTTLQTSMKHHWNFRGKCWRKGWEVTYFRITAEKRPWEQSFNPRAAAKEILEKRKDRTFISLAVFRFSLLLHSPLSHSSVIYSITSLYVSVAETHFWELEREPWGNTSECNPARGVERHDNVSLLYFTEIRAGRWLEGFIWEHVISRWES